MAAITGATTIQLEPNSGVKCFMVTTPSSADSNDTIDVSSASATGGDTVATIYYVVASDMDSADAVTATWSGTTVTIDAAGGTTNHTYRLLVWGR